MIDKGYHVTLYLIATCTTLHVLNYMYSTVKPYEINNGHVFISGIALYIYIYIYMRVATCSLEHVFGVQYSAF